MTKGKIKGQKVQEKREHLVEYVFVYVLKNTVEISEMGFLLSLRMDDI